MNKIKSVLSLLLLSSISLTSCNQNTGIVLLKNADYIYASEKANAFETNPTHLVSLLKSKSTLVLYMYSPNCSSCIEVSDFFKTYSNSNHINYYKIDMVAYHLQYPILSDYDNTLFPSNYIVTPRVLFIKEGKLDVEMNPSKFDSYTLFKGTMNNFSQTKNGFIFSELVSYQNLLNLNKNYLFFSYNSGDETSSTIYNQNIYPLITSRTDMNFYILDTYKVTEECENYIKEDLNVSDINNVYFTNKNQVNNYLTSPDSFSDFILNI